MKAAKPLMRVLGGERLLPPPVWLMRQAGRYLPEYRELRARAADFLDFCYTPALAAEATLQPIRRFGFDAAILFSDILVIPDALGRAVAFREGEGPQLDPVRDEADVRALRHENVVERLAAVLATVSEVAGQLPPETTFLGFAGSPWTVATYMVEGRGGTDFATVRAMATERPGMFGELIDRLTEATVAYLLAQAEAGVDAVQLFDSWAGALSGEAFGRWVIEPTRTIVARLKTARPGLPVIGFPRGAGELYVDYARETGVDAVSLDQGVDLEWAVAAIPSSVVLQGNLDPALLVAGGSAMEDAAERIVEVLRARPFVFNLGHGILPATPPSHVADLVTLLRTQQ